MYIVVMLRDLPRERLVQKGPSALSNSELLALVLGSGSKGSNVFELARVLMYKYESLNSFFDLSYNSLVKINGIGQAKASKVLAIKELSLRLTQNTYSISSQVKTPNDVYELLKYDLLNKDKEYLFVLSLDTKNRVVSKDLVCIGILNEVLIHPREIFKFALVNNAYSVLIVHNHPSNDPKPSDADIEITDELANAGLLLGIPVLDHLIFYNSGITSMKKLNLR
jgi:DNA repair protein RadC